MQLKGDDVLYDFGCGDGRLIIGAAQLNPDLKCVGIELDNKFSSRAFESVQKAGLEDRVKIISGDVQEVMSRQNHMQHCTAAFVYLLPKGLNEIKFILERVRGKENGRVVSYMFQIPDWHYTEFIKVDKNGICKIYLYE